MHMESNDSFTIGAPDEISLLSFSSRPDIPGFTTPVKNYFGERDVFRLGGSNVPVPVFPDVPTRCITRVSGRRAPDDSLNRLADTFVQEELCHAVLTKRTGTYHGFGAGVSIAMMNAHNGYHEHHSSEGSPPCSDCFVCQLETKGQIEFTAFDDFDAEVEFVKFSLFDHIKGNRKTQLK